MIRNEAPVMLGITQGKRGWPPLQAMPEEPRAWADTPWRTILGCALALVASVVWLRVVSTESYRCTQLNEAHAELEQLHSLLDVFPGCLARESEEKDSYKRTQYKAMTRLASWLAGRGTLAVTLSPKSAE